MHEKPFPQEGAHSSWIHLEIHGLPVYGDGAHKFGRRKPGIRSVPVEIGLHLLDAHFRGLGLLAVVRALTPRSRVGRIAGASPAWWSHVLVSSAGKLSRHDPLPTYASSDGAGTASRRLVRIIETPPAALRERCQPGHGRIPIPGYSRAQVDVIGLRLLVAA